MAGIVTLVSRPCFPDDQMAKDTTISRYPFRRDTHSWIVIQQDILLPKDDRTSARWIVHRTTQPDVRSFFNAYLWTFQYHWFRICTWLWLQLGEGKEKRQKIVLCPRSQVGFWFRSLVLPIYLPMIVRVTLWLCCLWSELGT